MIGLDLCPFAAPVVRAGAVRVAMMASTAPEDAVRDTLGEVAALVDADPDAVATTLVVWPHALADFETFLDVVETVDALLEESGADAVVQLAHFHPDYQFEGEPPDGASHFTNRAPYPILHLLRVDDVEDAIDRHPDSTQIPLANVARLEAMGPEALAALWRRWMPAPVGATPDADADPDERTDP